MRFAQVVGLFVFFLVAFVCFGDWNDTSTGIDLKGLPPFPLTKVHAGFLRPGDRVSFDGFTATDESPPPPNPWNEVVLRGKGKGGKAWMVHFAAGAFDQVYRGDLDQNGVQDYVVFGSEPFFNGRLAPPYHITVLLMDKNGLPMPFEWPLYDDLGPQHVVDLDHDGQAELVLSGYDEESWDVRAAGPFCSGHWITRLYQADALNWSEFHGSAGNVNWPFINRWTYAGTRCPIVDEPNPGFSETGPSRIDRPDFNADRLTSVLGTRRMIGITPSPSCDVDVNLVVYDQPNQREIALGAPFTNYPAELLERIRSDRARISLRGFSSEPQNRFCSAKILWASR